MKVKLPISFILAVFIVTLFAVPVLAVSKCKVVVNGVVVYQSNNPSNCSYQDTITDNSGSVTIVNRIKVKANSGGNSGGGSITTGNASAAATITNNVNNNSTP